jgi:hypothetical protein
VRARSDIRARNCTNDAPTDIGVSDNVSDENKPVVGTALRPHPARQRLLLDSLPS